MARAGKSSKNSAWRKQDPAIKFGTILQLLNPVVVLKTKLLLIPLTDFGKLFVNY